MKKKLVSFSVIAFRAFIDSFARLFTVCLFVRQYKDSPLH